MTNSSLSGGSHLYGEIPLDKCSLEADKSLKNESCRPYSLQNQDSRFCAVSPYGGAKHFSVWILAGGMSARLPALRLPAGSRQRFRYPRSESGAYSTRFCTHLYDGRMILPALSSSSMRWAHQPAIRLTAKMGVYSSSGRSSMLYTKPL